MMARPGAALINLLLLLDLPARPEIGHAGLEGSPLLRALGHHAGRLVDTRNGEPDRAALDLVVVHGAVRHAEWDAIRPGGWVIRLGDAERGTSEEFDARTERLAELRRWMIGPSLAVPLSIVPDTRLARRAHEFVSREAGWKRALRLAAIDRGWKPGELGGVAVAARIR